MVEHSKSKSTQPRSARRCPTLYKVLILKHNFKSMLTGGLRQGEWSPCTFLFRQRMKRLSDVAEKPRTRTARLERALSHSVTPFLSLPSFCSVLYFHPMLSSRCNLTFTRSISYMGHIYPVFHPLAGLDCVYFPLCIARTCLGSS